MEFATGTFIKQFESVQNAGNEIVEKLVNLGQAHLDLYKEEAKENKRKLFLACGFLCFAILTGFCTIIIGSFALVQFLMDEFNSLSRSQALAYVSLGWLLLTVIFAVAGIRFSRRIKFSPVATLKSVKESYQCIMNRN